MHYVYKYVLNGEIIYIGKTDAGLQNRLNQHGKPGDNIPREGWDEINASMIYYMPMVNEIMADVVESELIRRYKPKYNKDKKESAWGGIPFAEPEWYEYRIDDGSAGLSSNKHVPKYMQKPCTSAKRNEIKYRIGTDFSSWIILNAIKRYNLQPGMTYDLFQVYDGPLPELRFSYTYNCKTYPMISSYCDEGKGDERHRWITISKSLYSHCCIDDVLLYYKDRLNKEIHFLSDNYPSDTYNVKTKRRGYCPVDDIIKIFETCCNGDGIAV